MAFFEELSAGSHVFVQGAAATPQKLLELLTSESDDLRPLNLYHLHTEGKPPYLDPPDVDSNKLNNFYIKSFFVGSNLRPYIDGHRFDYIPCFLSEIPLLFRKRTIALDAALIQVSPPDAHGYCSLGTSVDVTRAAVETARWVYAQINPQVPRTHGDSFIHVSHIQRFIEVNESLPETPGQELNSAEKKIGLNVAELIENGATLQLGIGAVPTAVLGALQSHKDLGLHSEMWTDEVIPLIESGVINNSKKVVHPGKSVATFINGTKKLFDYVDDNAGIALYEASYVNSPLVIMRNPKVVAINSAVEIDLTGQVCADSVGTRIISGVGGQMDFLRAAALSENGKPILAITSRTKKGRSRIVSQLTAGAGVVTTRSHVHWVVTEYGAVNLVGKSLSERQKALIQIAHPEDRESLERSPIA
jgi:4-hydroxybutyrate CoA-transferase